MIVATELYFREPTVIMPGCYFGGRFQGSLRVLRLRLYEVPAKPAFLLAGVKKPP
jgi:hypothetical protein